MLLPDYEIKIQIHALQSLHGVLLPQLLAPLL